jgi:hypothetical protein
MRLVTEYAFKRMRDVLGLNISRIFLDIYQSFYYINDCRNLPCFDSHEHWFKSVYIIDVNIYTEVMTR